MKSPGGKGQHKISSFFAKKSAPSSCQAPATAATPAMHDVVDLTVADDSDIERPSKKTRTLNEFETPGNGESPFFQTNIPNLARGTALPSASTSNDTATPRKSISMAAKYSLNSPHKLSDERELFEEKKSKRARRDEFKRKLLGDNSIFTKKIASSSAPDQQRSPITSEILDVDNLPISRLSESGESELESDVLESRNFNNFLSSKRFSSSKTKDKGNGGNGSVEEVGPSGETYTPLEKQVLLLKEKYGDAVLMFEVGYKYIFFGKDAKIASEVLGIVCYTKRNFLVAGVPTHRRDIHMRRLLSRGYKVGIVGQMETAALKKVSDNRYQPFERALANMYTAATFIGDMQDVDEDEFSIVVPPIFVCIVESPLGGMGADERVSISLIAVTPSTGDVVWDEFEDGFMRNELESRMTHLRPSEILTSGERLSKITERLLQFHSKDISATRAARDKIRLERYKDNLSYTDAFHKLQNFYARRDESNVSEGFASTKLLASISELPRKVVIALAHSMNYLDTFGLANVLTQTQFFSRFTERQHMLLNANTLANLEIYRNQTDLGLKGSLMWILNKTQTSFGARLLRHWIGRPLVDINALRSRVDAVEAILHASSHTAREKLMRLQLLLRELKTVDLAKGLSRIQYKKCTPPELAKLLKAFGRIAESFDDVFKCPEDVGFTTDVLNDIIFALPKLRYAMRKILPCINLAKAREDKRDELWTDPAKYPEIDDAKMAIMTIESELADHLHTIRKILKKPAARYASWKDEEYLIEVEKSERREIPLTWEVVSSTKKLKRYRTPEARKKLQERAQYQETLEAEANKAFLSFLSEIMDDHYVTLRNAVNKLAIADCLFGFATLAAQDNYVKPTFVEDDVLEITDGRHPIVEVLRSDPFVHNSICIGGNSTRTKIITGPNMGGKSSAVRMVALIALMSQIGCYVPASSVRLKPLDAILTRMGASDDLARGRSTFMVEMTETSDILHSATSRSLVILDELGRGSSTFDGMAIAGAALEYLVEQKDCKNLFITHYPLVALSTERKFPKKVTNLHMGFTEETSIDGKTTITFLYKLTKGISPRSYGIECARLAGVPEGLLESASEHAEKMQSMVQRRSRLNLTRKACEIYKNLQTCNKEERKRLLEELRLILEITMALPRSDC